FKCRQNGLYREGCKKMAVKDVANYLIQEYWRHRIEGLKITCTRTKIGKLLTIIQILSIKCRRELAFDDTIVTETCGTSVPILSIQRYPYDIWELNTDEVEKTAFSKKPVFFEQNSRLDLNKAEKVDKPLPKLYETRENIDESLKQIIEDVFEEYGAYDSYEIGKFINEFKEKICVNEIVDQNEVVKWLDEIERQPIENNELIMFIYNYHIDT
ncbi:MAG: hypothetical protein K2J79_03785, partial [Ruminiclostridium sp.]|nr:hypothetical protein [Ruminiclostridium sp.]